MTARDTTTTYAEAEIRALLDRLTEAWNAADAHAYGAGFTRDATYITFVGTLYRGRADIAVAHQALFGSLLKGTKLAGEILDIRLYGPDTAVVTARGDTYKGSRPRKLGKLQTYTVVRQPGGAWLIAAFHNTQRKPLMESISFLLKPATKPRQTR